MMGTRHTLSTTTPRPGFADELLARLAADAGLSDRGPGAGRVVAGAVGGATFSAAIALLLAHRRRER